LRCWCSIHVSGELRSRGRQCWDGSSGSWRHEIQQEIARCGCGCWLTRGRSFFERIRNRLSQIGVFLFRIVGSLDRNNVVGIVRSNRTDRTNLVIAIYVRRHVGIAATIGIATVVVTVAVGVVVSSRRHRVVIGLLLPSASSCRPRIVGGQPQSKDLWKGKEGLAIHKEIVLPKSGNSGHGRLGVRHNLEDVVPLHGPRKIKDIVPVFGNMHLLSVRQYKTFSRGNTPNNGNVVFFATTIRSSLSGRQGVHVGKPESPSDTTFRTSNPLSTCHGREIDLVDVGLISLA